ncbi:hypothetical protein ACVBEH_25950, partial [Roseateles sp. GG27B]
RAAAPKLPGCLAAAVWFRQQTRSMGQAGAGVAASSLIRASKKRVESSRLHIALVAASPSMQAGR